MALQLIPLGPPATDSFTPLSQIGTSFFKQYDDARKRRFEDDFAKSNADLITGMSPAAPAPMPQSGTLGSMGQTSVGGAKMPPEQVKRIIDANVPEADREYAYRMAAKESAFNPSAKSPTGARGLYQFTRGTGQEYDLVGRDWDQRDNPEANTRAFVRFTEDNRNKLRRALGREPTYGELAVAHQQGAGGAISLITGTGSVDPRNLAVQAGNPKNAADIMRYYGYEGGGQPAAPRGRVQVASAAGGAGYTNDTPAARPQTAPVEGPPMLATAEEAGIGAQQPLGMAFAPQGVGFAPFGRTATPPPPTPVQRPPMGLAGAMPQSGGFTAPQAPAPQQMAQAGSGAAADPFGFSRMPPQVAAAVKSMMVNPLPAAQARAQSIIERYVKTEQWAPFTDPNTGASLQRNSNTGEVKLIQTAPSRYQVQRLENGDILAVDQTTGKPDLIRAGEQDALLRQYEAAKRDPNNPFKGSVFDFKKQLAEAASTKIDNSTRAEGELEKGFAGTTVKRYSGFIDKGDQARAMLGDISTLRDISRRVGSQGKTAEVKMALGPYAEALGIDVKDLSDLQAADAIIQRLAPQMHVPGSGATSDIEFKGFVKSLGSMTNNPQAREMIYDTFEAFSRYDMERGAIASAFANKEISRNDAEKQIKALGDPLTRYREWKKTQGSTEAAAPEVAPPGKRAPLPDGYTASRMVNEAKRALRVAPGAKSEIADKLRSHGIDPKVLD